jgi:hypothetical protein
MLHHLDSYSGTAEQRLNICQAFDSALERLKQPSPRGNRALVGQIEALVAKDPSRFFEIDADGWTKLKVDTYEYHAGRFRCVSLHQLRQQLDIRRSSTGHQLKLFALTGPSPITDIGALQGSAAPNSLFQVASQFNCLESPGAYLVPVANYFSDPTQGPRASISAYPATLLRHYSAPREGRQSLRYLQKDPQPQVNLLHRVALPGVAAVRNGYLTADAVKDPATFARLLHDHFDEIEVGVHEGAQVVLGANWDGPVVGHGPIAQVFTSTLAAGGYSRVDLSKGEWMNILRQLQRAAYLGTLLAAASTGQRRVVLTLIGGGVFGNPLPLIWESIVWACQQVQPLLAGDLSVVVNGRNLAEGVAVNTLKSDVQKFGGEVILCSASGTRFE